ncbi:MAG: DUF7331 family protein [Halovenus sp.]
MSSRVNAAGESERAANPETTPGAETVECYEDDEDLVMYDAENPLAWIQADTAVRIEDAV